MNTIATFTWKGKLPTDEEVAADPATRISADYGEQWAYQACQPVAVDVIEAVRKTQRATIVEGLHYDELGWHFQVKFDQSSFSIMVQWIPDDRNDQNDRFSVQPSLCRGCLASLLLPTPSAVALRPACDILQEALSHNPIFDDVRWISKLW